ncbi:hypothetical protein M6D81_15365 [Paenibacillus sp. J5C_2022]|nr:hypothetical protein [Paenibacillus sp. J5C2022]
MKKPEITDHIHQTVIDLHDNFQKLDDAAEVYIDATPTSGSWTKNKKLYYTQPQNGGYVGIINLREGKAAPRWGSITPYAIGDEVIPAEDNGHYYSCIQSGYSSPFEPVWSTSDSSVTEDTFNKEVWQPSKSYSLHDIVLSSITNDRFYVCITPGTSGVNEPQWATSNGVSTTDNEVVWMTYRIVKWQEVGSAAHFRPFGKIE